MEERGCLQLVLNLGFYLFVSSIVLLELLVGILEFGNAFL
jgi:predicted nucleic acid-binding protein